MDAASPPPLDRTPSAHSRCDQPSVEPKLAAFQRQSPSFVPISLQGRTPAPEFSDVHWREAGVEIEVAPVGTQQQQPGVLSGTSRDLASVSDAEHMQKHAKENNSA